MSKSWLPPLAVSGDARSAREAVYTLCPFVSMTTLGNRDCFSA